MSNPLVSICSASYKHEQFLDSFFDSIVKQTYRPIELVLVEDFSPDRSKDVITRWLPRLSEAGIKYTVCHHGSNLGGFVSFDWAFEQAKGEYIALLETDDFIYPTKIEESVQFLLENPDFVAVHSDTDYANEDGTTNKRFWRSVNRNIPSPTTFQFLLRDNSIMTCSFMCQSDIFKISPKWEEWQRRGYMMADYPTFLWIAKQGNIGYLDKSLAVYRKHANGASWNPETRHLFIQSTEQIKRDAITGRI